MSKGLAKRMPYVRTPGGADRWALADDVWFHWASPPDWAFAMPCRMAALSDGTLMRDDRCVPRMLSLCVLAGFHFSVSIAPDFPRAMPAACLHDWIYSHADELAALWGCRVRDVLALADHWFLAQMRAEGFLLKRTYYAFVRLFGYHVNRIGRRLRWKGPTV